MKRGMHAFQHCKYTGARCTLSTGLQSLGEKAGGTPCNTLNMGLLIAVRMDSCEVRLQPERHTLPTAQDAQAQLDR